MTASLNEPPSSETANEFKAIELGPDEISSSGRNKTSDQQQAIMSKQGANLGSFEQTPSSMARPNGAADLERAADKKNGHTKEAAAATAAASGGDPAEKRSLLLRLADTIPCLGIIMALCASLFLGSAGMLVKMTRSVHGIQVAVLRSAIQLVIYGFVISVRRLPLLPERGELKPVLGRAFLGATSITFSYYALRLIPLGDATTIRFSLPIWTLIISYLVLGEPCNLLRIVAVVISISGVVLIAKPDDCVHVFHLICHSLDIESSADFSANQLEYEQFRRSTMPNMTAALTTTGEASHLPSAAFRQLEGSLLALASSVCLSMSLIALRLCQKTQAEIVILWLSIISIVIGSITLVALNAWSMPDNWLDVFYILMNGFCGSVGQWFITNALKVEQSGIISLVRTFDIEVAFLYSAFLLHEHIRITSIMGSILVTVGVFTVLVPKWLWPRKDQTTTTTMVAGKEPHDSDGTTDEQRRAHGPSKC